MMKETTKKILKAYAILAGAAAACALGFWGVEEWESKSHDKTTAEREAREAQEEVERVKKLLQEVECQNRSLQREAATLRHENTILTIKNRSDEVRPAGRPTSIFNDASGSSGN